LLTLTSSVSVDSMRCRWSSVNGSNCSGPLSARSATSDASPPEQLNETIFLPVNGPPASSNFNVSSSCAGVSTVATP